MKPLQKIGAAAMAGALALVLGACGAQPASAPEAEAASGSYRIGVIQLTEHAALDAANEGFIAALDDSGIDYTVDQQNAQGDQSACQTIASKLVNDGDDLILAIGTPAAQAVAGSTTEIPVVGTAVTDFAVAGLVESNDAPGGNVTGTSDLNPVSDQIALLRRLVPDAKTVGILYCSAEDNSGIQADLAEEACKNAGLATQRFTVSSSNEIQQVVESMAGKVDAVYAPTDNVIAAGIATVSMVANENGLPVICGEENMVNGGGLATYSLNYYDLGYRAGEMAVKILKGEAKPADMPIEYLSGDDLKLVVNEETAKALGIDVSGLEG
ncbi:ABC transporter substrate-binding protein [Caniella muris]|uniref:ABC transporter substrate-binding protein n=1 Tax=Caniella muris TaxID=2941502 RepID=UPI00203F5B25|nr:ABC transporter substrate-binding protein [Caniella muris]